MIRNYHSRLSGRQVLHSLLASIVVALCSVSSVDAADTRTISRAELLDKIRGGWAGQMIGVSFGAPTEFKFNGKTIDQELEWKTEMLSNTLDQDDLYVEMTFAKVMDDIGLGATCEQYGEAFKVSEYGLWHANAGARRALGRGIKAPWSGHPKYNFHADDIDFQIEADFIGLMCPGLPQESNKYCDRVGRVMNYGDGLYGGMFVCGMYSAAYFENDPRKIVEAGLACIPAKSKYAQINRDLLNWSAQYPGDWRKVWQMVEDKWNKNDICPECADKPINIDAKINGAYIAFGLLFGGGDFARTMEISTRCGQDSDCNPSSAAGVLGVVLGYDRIPEKFKAGMAELENKKFNFTDYSFNDIVKSTEARALQIIKSKGGTVTDTSVKLRLQKPKAPKLEQWNPGIPKQRVGNGDSGWAYSGSWKDDRGAKVSTTKGDEATFTFEGVAVAILGEVSPTGGRADVYVDGKKADQADAYVGERTWDTVLWHTYGLKPGKHTVRFVTTDAVDSRSKGKRIGLYGAVVYDAEK